MRDYIKSFLSKYWSPGFLYRAVLASFGPLLNLDISLYRFRRLLRSNLGARERPRLYVACTGQDYQRETRLFLKWMRKKRLTGDNCRVLVFSYAMLPLLREHFPVVYYRDIVSQQEELEYFGLAYKLVKELSAWVLSQEPEFASLLAAAHHSWAADMFVLMVLQKEIERMSLNASEVTVAVINMPWRTGTVALTPLPFAAEYDVLNTTRRFREHKLLQNAANALHLWDKLFREEQKSLGELSPFLQPSDSRLSTEEATLVFTEDSGSYINLTSGKAFVLEMKRRGFLPVVLTSSDLVAKELAGTGACVYKIPRVLRSVEYLDSIRALARFNRMFDGFMPQNKPFVWDLFCDLAMPNIHTYLKRVANVKLSIDALCSRYSFSSAVTFGESDFVPAAALEYLASRDVPTIGIEPVIVMDHPMCEFWPAREHLAYGDQMQELLIKQGVPAESIHVVGSEHFDRSQRRNKEADIKYTRDLFPQSVNRKLVVIATENRSRQMIEIEPSVRALAKDPSVFTIVKVHPDEMADAYLRLVQDLGNPVNVVVSGRGVDTLALIHAADLLVTMGSNLIVEAGVMGTLSLVYNFAGAPCPIDFVKEGLCFGAYSVEEFEKLFAALIGDENLRKEAYNKLKLISRFNGPNDGKAVKRMVDFAIRSKKEMGH